MNKLMTRIENTDYVRGFTRLIITTVIVLVAALAVNGYMFRTQISELIALDKADEQYSLQSDYQADSNTAGQTNGTDAGFSVSKGASSGVSRSKTSAGDAAHDHDGHDEEFDLIKANITPPSTAAVVLLGVSVMLCGLCGLAYWLMVAAWLYKASAETGMNRTLWTVLGLLFNLAAVLAFLIARGRRSRCSVCGTWQDKGRFCRKCGAELMVVCEKCGSICSSKDIYCAKCGAELKVSAEEKEE